MPTPHPQDVTILDRIIEHKRNELAAERSATSEAEL